MSPPHATIVVTGSISLSSPTPSRPASIAAGVAVMAAA
jgi:hypothetical protein